MTPWSLWMALTASLGWRPPALKFADPAMEARFAASRKEARLNHHLVSGAVALVIYNVFLVVDPILVPDAVELGWRIRLLYFTPPALLLLVGSTAFKKDVLSLPGWFIDSVVTLTGIGAGVSMLVIVAHSQSHLATTYYAGLMPIVIYGNLVQRFSFQHAAVFSGFTCGMLIGRVVYAGRPPGSFGWEMELSLVMLVLLVTLYSLIMNYRLELEERRRFAGSDRAQGLRDALEASRRAYARLSRLDGLTGLPNRRDFEEHLAQAWAEHRHTRQPLALCLIDVDHFKAYNDRHGHPAGDQCLKLIAQAMASSVSGGGAQLARWGGEEFIVVLPWATEASAKRLADSLQQAVSGLSLRHEASPSGARVSISLGVCLMSPDQPGASIDRLICKADEALYQAKRQGRDRWVLVSADHLASQPTP
jgi:diguanylate cyclase (GGDEF)-like protein